SEIPITIAIACGPRVPSSGTFVRLPAPETLHVCGPAALRRRDAKPDLEIGVDLDDALHTSANLQQKQIKYGLTDPSAIACHEAGFGDRHVASILNLVWGNVVDRVGVRAACQQEKIVRAVLVHIPSYSPGSLLNLEDGLGARHDQIRRSERELFVCDRARCTLVADASQQRLF
ncbi:hypothetical protein, partial [Rhizobium sp. Root1204]|uniref:hypothetical protein n=1 Tax=Rhizobium sp. Root1204 TaxID=1736428 RepID=UPI000A79B0BD